MLVSIKYLVIITLYNSHIPYAMHIRTRLMSDIKYIICTDHVGEERMTSLSVSHLHEMKVKLSSAKQAALKEGRRRGLLIFSENHQKKKMENCGQRWKSVV